MPLVSLPLTTLLDRIASPDPTPGGGSVAAVAGACGAALAEMVAGLPKTRGNTDEERATLAALRPALSEGRQRLTALVDEDTDAFNELMAAFRLPKATDDEKAARRAAIQAATQLATIVPLETVEVGARLLKDVMTVARIGNPSASSDVAVGIGVLRAAVDGAAANVRTNLGGLTDESVKAMIVQRLERALGDAADAASAAAEATQG
jgi:formiminotetrahydrofolate cyclodeaminase